MDLLSLIGKRYSVRSYLPQPVESEKVNYLLECARLAPSAVNFQPWKFIVVKSDERKARLRACYAREWFSEAPLYIVVCADREQSWKRRKDGKDHADIDAAIAAEHIVLAAAEQGLGSCWVCNFDATACREALDLPVQLEPVVLLPIGYPGADNGVRQPRKSLAEAVEEL